MLLQVDDSCHIYACQNAYQLLKYPQPQKNFYPQIKKLAGAQAAKHI